jgi:hypothetical protein
MKQRGHELIGDNLQVESYTNTWMQIKIHPLVFYRRYDTFAKGFKSVKGLYAALDMGQYVAIRFSEKSDVTAFHRMHHEYV